MSDADKSGLPGDTSVPLSRLAAIIADTLDDQLKKIFMGPQGHFTRLVKVIAEVRQTVFGFTDNKTQEKVVGLVELVRQQAKMIEAQKEKLEEQQRDLAQVSATVYGFVNKDDGRVELGLVNVVNTLQPQVLLALRHGTCQDAEALARECKLLDQINGYSSAAEYWKVAAGGSIAEHLAQAIEPPAEAPPAPVEPPAAPAAEGGAA